MQPPDQKNALISCPPLESLWRLRSPTLVSWTVETVSAVDAELEALPVRLRSRLIRLLEAVENVGLAALGAKDVQHLDGKLWEFRVKAKEGIARGISVTVTGRRVVVSHFSKKVLRMPKKALAIVNERMKKVAP